MASKAKYALRCVAPDGDFITEGYFNSVDEALERADDMGSRWFFYPFHVVTGHQGKTVTQLYDRTRVISAPDFPFLRELQGKSFKTFRRFIADNEEVLLEILNG